MLSIIALMAKAASNGFLTLEVYPRPFTASSLGTTPFQATLTE